MASFVNQKRGDSRIRTMIRIVIVRGGLGNQMFAYAFYLYLKRKYWYSLVYLDILIPLEEKPHNGYELRDLFSIPRRYNIRLNRRIRKLYSRYFTRKYTVRVVDRTIGTYTDTAAAEAGLIVLYDGYWQSEKYFEQVKHELRQVFRFDPAKLGRRSREKGKEIGESQSVSIHVRRGDYLGHEELNGICTLDYYHRAILEMERRVGPCRFFVFTDDPCWVREHLTFISFDLIDWNKGSESWQDMYLMGQCRHNIIANSSFSWWGAWLNANPDKVVIAPSGWFRSWVAADITPEYWIRV